MLPGSSIDVSEIPALYRTAFEILLGTLCVKADARARFVMMMRADLGPIGIV